MIGEENLFQNVLASFQARRGWTQEDAAAHIGVSRSTYSGWITGKNIPAPKQLFKIAAGFKLNQADLETLTRAAAHTPPRIHNLPFPRNPLFTGRETYLASLDQLFQQNDSVALTQPISISGLGGIGKTQLALEYAHRCFPNVYQTVFWVNAADEAALMTSYVKLAHRLELPERDEQELEVIVQAIKDWLARHTNWLLIMDNADDLELARSFFPEAHSFLEAQQGRILLTTRSQIVSEVVATQIEIDKMGPDEGLRFLLLRSRKLKGDDTPDMVAPDIRESGRQLVEVLDGHPLALDQAGAYILEAHVSFTDYKDLYSQTRRELLNTRWLLDDEHREHPEYSQHPETVAVTFDLCFKQAQKRHLLAGDLLNFCAFLSPDAIPEELFQHDDSFKYGTTVFNKAIAALLRFSLIKRNDEGKTLSLHRLVQAVLIDAMDHIPKQQWRERVMQAVNAGFPRGDYNNWGQCERLLPHVLVCARWPEHDLQLTNEASELFHAVGSYLIDRGRYSEATEFLLKRALSITEQNQGDEHPDTVRRLYVLAIFYWVQEKYSQAEPLYLRALAIQEKLVGVEHLETTYTLSQLAFVYSRQGKYSQAEPLYQQALSIREKYLGDGHPETAKSLSDLSDFYQHQHEYAMAESFQVRALAIYEKHLGDGHPETAKSLNQLGSLYSRQGKYSQAEPLYLRALAIYEKHLGDGHPETAVSLNQLGLLYREQGKYEQAESLLRRALKILEKHRGAEDPYTITSLFGLALVLANLGKYEQSETMLRHVLSIEEQRLGVAHPFVQFVKESYAKLLQKIECDTETPAYATDEELSV